MMRTLYMLKRQHAWKAVKEKYNRMEKELDTTRMDRRRERLTGRKGSKEKRRRVAKSREHEVVADKGNKR